jgi:hypothetical protein
MQARLTATLLLFLLIWMPQVRALTIELTAEDIQAQLAGQFPVRQERPYITVILSDPVVMLEDNSDRIGVELTVSTTTLGNIVGHARGLVDGRLRYVPQTGEFFLVNPEVRRLQVAGVPQQYQRDMQSVVAAVAKDTLARLPVYRLNEQDPNQALAKRHLKSATVRDGRLVLDLQLF